LELTTLAEAAEGVTLQGQVVQVVAALVLLVVMVLPVLLIQAAEAEAVRWAAQQGAVLA
jgi:hypothetical protein